MQRSKIKNIFILVRNKRLDIINAEIMLYDEFNTSVNNSVGSNSPKKNTTDMFM